MKNQLLSILAMVLLSLSNIAQAQDRPFITTWEVTDDDLSVTIPNSNFDEFMIDWGDGTSSNANFELSTRTHNYSVAGIYTIEISGDYTCFKIQDSGDNQKIRTIEQWGSMKWTSMQAAFADCINLTYNAEDVPNLESVTDMSAMFSGAESFNGEIGDWDVSNVELMPLCFSEASKFNQDLNNWNVSNVHDMERMFKGATEFNGEIGNWQTSSLERVGGMFDEASNFNQSINSWNVSNITHMANLFRKATAFNQDLNGWDMSKVRVTVNMFFEAKNFNGDISNWNTENFILMSQMFLGAESFNQNISEWKFPNSRSTYGMFAGATSFNQPIGVWDMSNVNGMEYMFAGKAVDGQLQNNAFNQDIGSWDVSNVIDMKGMFSDCDFNQNLSDWNVSNVKDLMSMFDNSAMSIENYDSTLIGWSKLTLQNANTVFNGITLGATGIGYCNADEERAKIIQDFGWIIQDGGSACNLNGAPFITTWEVTDHDLSLTITPFTSLTDELGNFFDIGAYNYEIKWGDGTSQTGNNSTLTHTYESAGIYQVEISGRLPYFKVSNQDTSKLRTIEQWGDIEWEVFHRSFEDAHHLTYNATDSPNLSKTKTTAYMFANCHNFDGDISNWDVSNVEYMFGMFFKAFEFNQDISDWEVSNVKDMRYMFQQALSFNQDIGGWNMSNVTNTSYMFTGSYYSPDLGYGSFNQDIGNWDVSSVNDMQYMFYRTPFNQDIGDWNVSKVENMNNMFHKDTVFNQDIGRWNVSNVKSMKYMFGGGDNIDNFETSDFNQDIGSWDVSNVEYLNGMFYRTNFNQDLNEWDISNVISMYSTFAFSKDFDGDISNWQTGNVIDMSLIFFGAESFNQNISSWDVSKVTDMHFMFYDAESFNQPIGNWDVSNVTDMSTMFTNTHNFNQNINDWDVSEVTSMSGMFSGAYEFNQPLNKWNVSSVTSMRYMFNSWELDNPTKFNQDISNWDVSNVEDMNSMFRNSTSFNQPIGDWNVSNVTDMTTMFVRTYDFNQDLSNWDVSNVERMFGMFSRSAFNTDVSDWSTSNVKDMSYAFYKAPNFDQNLGSWDISKVNSLTLMLDSSGMSTENYDSTLIGWSQLTLQNADTVEGGISLGASAINYCLGNTARAKIIEDFGWTIEDAGRLCDFGVSGVVYNDANGNKTKDEGEFGLANQRVMLLPDSCFTLTDEEGNYRFSANDGDYQVVINPQTIWELSTDTEIFDISFPNDDGTEILFGLKAKSDLNEVSTSLTSTITRCGFTIPFWLSYKNDGTAVSNGMVKLLPDSKTNFVSSNPTFTSQSGDTLIWNFSGLQPTQQKQIRLNFEMPTQEATGDSVEFVHWADFGGAVNYDTLSSEITCAYDPNDKTATPYGVGEERYTLKDEFLEYRIRFQNTGNDTAFNVIIRDTLQSDFDLSSFEVIASSFPVRTQVESKDKSLAFYLDNIQLADSTVDEPNSHGFVTFRIKPNAVVAEETEVRNTAFIYFDFNTAIQTNSTLNTLVTTLPIDKVAGIELEDISNRVSLFPNPVNGSEVFVRLENANGEKQISILDISGREVLEQNPTERKSGWMSQL